MAYGYEMRVLDYMAQRVARAGEIVGAVGSGLHTVLRIQSALERLGLAEWVRRDDGAICMVATDAGLCALYDALGDGGPDIANDVERGKD